MKQFALLSLMILVGSASSAAERTVDIELVLAVDVSGSMSYEEHDIQRRGFLAAFADKQLLAAITSGPRGRIAVTYLEWAGPNLQEVLVPWHVISGRRSAMQFRALLAAKPRSPIRGTSISSALAYSATLFENNGITSFRQVIDISGDGHNRTGPNLLAVRNQVLQRNIVINGLPIMLSPTLQQGIDGYGLDQYFRECVIGGPSAFVYPVVRKTELAEAIRRKLILEISGLPTHGTHTLEPITVTDQKIDCGIGRFDRDDQ